MKVSTVHLVIAVICVLLCCVSVSAFFPGPYRNRNIRQSMPRCTSASKPCRIRAVMRGPGFRRPQVISSQPCSCPSSTTCSSDWEGDRDRVIVRRLFTFGKIVITLSMMFCDTVQPQRRCRRGDTAVQLAGMSHVPTEVVFINCTCANTRPLVLDHTSVGRDHKNYHTYVCNNHKRRCSRLPEGRQTCLEANQDTRTISYPCKCSGNTSCVAHNDAFGVYSCRTTRF